MHIPFKTLKKQKTGSGQGSSAQNNRSVSDFMVMSVRAIRQSCKEIARGISNRTNFSN